MKLTDFQKQVYEYCKKIPKGKVATYGILAASMGKPKAARAVGTALRKNPFAPKVPCHRVIASDLGLGMLYYAYIMFALAFFCIKPNTFYTGGFNGSKSDEVLKRKYDMLIHEGVKFESASSLIPNIRVHKSSVASSL